MSFTKSSRTNGTSIPSTPSKRAAIGDLRLLWAEGVPAKCEAKVLDTVLFKDAKPYRWLFTNKNVQVSKKKDSNLMLRSVRDRFIRLADVLGKERTSDSKNGGENKVAVVYTTDGSRMELDRESFEELLTTSSDGKSLHGVAALQACLPRNARSSSSSNVFQAEYRSDTAPGTVPKVTTKTVVVDAAPGGNRRSLVVSESRNVNKELESTLFNTVKFIEGSARVRIKNLTGNFIADKNGMLWLSNFHQIALEPTKHDSEKTDHDEQPLPPSSLSGGGSNGTSVRLLAMKRERERRSEGQGTNDGGGSGAAGSKSSKAHILNYEEAEAPDSREGVPGQFSLRNSELERPSFPGSRGGKGKNKISRLKTLEKSKLKDQQDRNSQSTPNDDSTEGSLPSSSKGGKLSKQANAEIEESRFRSEALVVELSEATEKIEKMEARLRAESTVNARLTERLQALRKQAHKDMTMEKEHESEITGRLRRNLETAVAKCQESEDRCTALTINISELQSSVSQLQIRLDSETKAADRESNRSKELSKKLANTQREFARAMREKDEHVRREVLATEERMNREMSQRPGTSENGQGSPTAKHLIRTVDELNKKLSLQQTEHASLQAELVTRNRLELLEREEEFQKQSNSDRQNIQQMEDRIQELQSQMCIMVKDVSISKKREEELNRRLSAADAEKSRVQDELMVAQQSIKAVQSMGDGSVGSADLQQASQVSAMKATSEAKIRQLNNEVDFLRAQLTSEIKCRSDLETGLQNTNEKYLSSKERWETALGDLENSKRESMRELEDRFRQELLIPQEEVHRLEDKVQALQKNLGEMVKDLSLARKQTESLSRAKQALTHERDGLQDRVAHYVNEIQGMKSKAKESLTKNSAEAAFRTTVETDMRKLQHELEYVRSQLASEIRCKEDLETALSQAEHQMDSQQRMYSKELEDQVLKYREENSKTIQRESGLRDSKIALDGEVLNLSKQLADLKKSYAKLRDQHRVDVGQLDATKQSASRLEVALQNARGTLKREKNAADSAQKRHERAMAAIQQTVKEMSDAKNAAISAADEQIKSNMAKVSATQREMLALKDHMKYEKGQHQKLIATERMGNALQGWLLRRSKEKFDHWRVQTNIEKVSEIKENSFQTRLEEEKRRAKLDKDRTCALLLEEYRHNKDSAIGALKRMEDKRREENALMAAEDVKANRMREDERLQGALRHAEKMHADNVENINNQHSDMVDSMNLDFSHKSKEAFEFSEKVKLEAIQATEREAGRQQEAALELAAKIAEEARRKQSEEAAANLREAVAVAESALKAIHDDQTNRMKLEQAKELQRASDRLRETQEEMRKHERESLGLAADQASKAQKHALEVLALQKQKELEIAIAQQVSARHAEINDLKKVFEKEKTHYLKEAAEQFEEQLAGQRHKARENLQSELAKAAAERESMLESLRDKADKMKTAALQYQTSKWQATLKECMAEAEKEKAKLQAYMEDAKVKAVAAENEAGNSRLEDEQKLAERNLKDELEKAQKEAYNIKEAALKDLDARKQAALEGALERARVHTENQLKQKQLDHEEILRQKDSANDAAAEVALKLAHTKQKNAVAQAEAKAAAERDSALRRAVAESKRRADTVRSECLKEQERVVADLMNKHNEAMSNALEAARTEREKALQDLAERARRELDHAVQMLEKQREKQVGRLTDALQKSEREKAEAKEDLDNLRDQLEESEDQNYDLKNQLSGVRRVGVMQRLYLISSKIREAKNEKKLLADARLESDARIKQLSKQKDRQIDTLRDKNSILDAEVRLHEETRAAMHDTLVNHKRAMLMEHKVQSTVLQKDLAALIEQKDEVDKQRNALVKENARLEGTVKEIERQIHEMSKQSAIQDGRINVAHAKKKRRLDQEFERVLEKVQEKRDHLSRVEKKLQQLDDARQDKEDEMKELERNLVQLLVEQQKKLLSVLQTSKSNSKAAKKKASMDQSQRKMLTD